MLGETSSDYSPAGPDVPRQSEVVSWAVIEAPRMLASLWLEVLGEGTPLPGPDDDFFAFGGHSLDAMQLGFRIYDVFQVEIPLHLILENSRLDAMAQCVMRALANSQDGEATHILDDVASLSDAEVEALLEEL